MDAVFTNQRICRRAHRTGCAAHGFTLVELIIVIVLLGVLAVVAAPRIFNNTDFYARGFHDETMALLRYAQKTAIAQRRTVCLAISSPAPAYISLMAASSAGATTCDVSVVGPNKNTAEKPVGSGKWFCEKGGPIVGAVTAQGCVCAASAISYTTTLTALSFDGLGQPLDGAGAPITAARLITVIGSGKVITIEPATGYVHE